MSAVHDEEPVVPGPKPGKHPLKTSVYLQARHSSTQLLPLFPYDEAGDIVPASASMRAWPGGPALGHFQHTNAVDEVAVSFGSSGEIRSGDVFVGPKTHGVGGWGEHGEFFAVLSITQRQVERGPQPEVIAFTCEKCHQEVARHDFQGALVGPDRGKFPPLPTIGGSAHSAHAFNASEASRTCKACGHLNAPFPLPIWGWDRYMFNTGIVEDARAALEEAAKQ
jgi:hypothetical protein